MADAETGKTSRIKRWLLRVPLFMMLLVLGATAFARDTAVLLISYVFLLMLVGIPLGIWRKKLGTAEVGLVLFAATVLFAGLVRFGYKEPMLCHKPEGYPYALTFERTGEVADRVSGDVESDDSSISISFSAKARPEQNFAPIVPEMIDSIHAQSSAFDDPLTSGKLYVVDGYWSPSAVDADTAMTQGQARVWRLPVFAREDERFIPVGDITGTVTLPTGARVTNTPYRMLGVRPGNATDGAKRELSRYNHDLLVERILKTGRPADGLGPYRARAQQCRPAWWASRSLLAR